MDEITVDHVSYYDQRLDGETTNERLWVIAKQQPRDSYEFQQAKVLAQYWYNIITYGCEYNIAIHRRLKALLPEFKDDPKN